MSRLTCAFRWSVECGCVRCLSWNNVGSLARGSDSAPFSLAKHVTLHSLCSALLLFQCCRFIFPRDLGRCRRVRSGCFRENMFFQAKLPDGFPLCRWNAPFLSFLRCFRFPLGVAFAQRGGIHGKVCFCVHTCRAWTSIIWRGSVRLEGRESSLNRRPSA